MGYKASFENFYARLEIKKKVIRFISFFFFLEKKIDLPVTVKVLSEVIHSSLMKAPVRNKEGSANYCYDYNYKKKSVRKETVSYLNKGNK